MRNAKENKTNAELTFTPKIEESQKLVSSDKVLPENEG